MTLVSGVFSVGLIFLKEKNMCYNAFVDSSRNSCVRKQTSHPLLQDNNWHIGATPTISPAFKCHIWYQRLQWKNTKYDHESLLLFCFYILTNNQYLPIKSLYVREYVINNNHICASQECCYHITLYSFLTFFSAILRHLHNVVLSLWTNLQYVRIICHFSSGEILLYFVEMTLATVLGTWLGWRKRRTHLILKDKTHFLCKAHHWKYFRLRMYYIFFK